MFPRFWNCLFDGTLNWLNPDNRSVHFGRHFLIARHHRQDICLGIKPTLPQPFQAGQVYRLSSLHIPLVLQADGTMPFLSICQDGHRDTFVKGIFKKLPVGTLNTPNCFHLNKDYRSFFGMRQSIIYSAFLHSILGPYYSSARTGGHPSLLRSGKTTPCETATSLARNVSLP